MKKLKSCPFCSKGKGVSELLTMYRWASIRLARICELRQGRLEENEPASADTGTDK